MLVKLTKSLSRRLVLSVTMNDSVAMCIPFAVILLIVLEASNQVVNESL